MFDLFSVKGSKVYRKEHIDPEDVFLDSSNISSFNINQFEGHLEKPLSPRIRNIFLICIFFIFIAFSCRLFYMQIIKGDVYSYQALNNHVRSTPIFAHRGTISDRNGVLLGWNEEENIASTTPYEIPRRVYIKQNGFSHILGYVSYPKKDSAGIFWQEEYIGRDGIERKYQDRLQGVAGKRFVAVSANNQIEYENVAIEPVDGENLTLTIDAKVQSKLYQAISELARKVGFSSGAGVIMDVRTGEVLALVSYPEYDNNTITNPKTDAEKERVVSDLKSPKNVFLNRAVSGLFTPGSTMKPFIAYAALKENVISPEKKILSTGALVIKNKYGGPDTVFRDWKVHGYIDMREAIAQSSDEYFYQIGGGYMSQPGLGIARIDQYAKMFGFGTTTGIDLPGENAGVVPTPEWKKLVFNEDWILGNTYHTAIGQYGFQVTPLELVRGVAAIANGGTLVTPHLVKTNTPLFTIDLHLDQTKLQIVREGMRQAVLGQTAKALAIEGLEIAAKSGTAELGVTKALVNSWISGYFPYESPRYAFVVIMEKGSRFNPTGAVFAMRDTLEWMRDTTDYTK